MIGVKRYDSAHFRNLDQFGESVVISCTEKEGVMFSAKGDIGSGTVKLGETANDNNNKEAVSIVVKESVALSFGCRSDNSIVEKQYIKFDFFSYLTKFAKASCFASQVTLSMSPDVPLLVQYSIGDIGEMRFYLAAEIEDGDD